MRQQFLNLASVLMITGLAIFNTGCKEDTIIKAGIAPATDNIFSNPIGDTLTIITKTVMDDSVNTSFTSSTIPVIHGLGTLNDPLFGRTNWGIYVQVLPTAANLTLPATPDSAVLIIPYYNFSWGDTTSTAPAVENFTVYRVTENMSKDDDYDNRTTKAVDRGTPVSVATPVNLYRLKKDSIKVAGVVRGQHLRIKLTGSFLTELVNAAKNSSDNAAFLNTIKGLYIEATDTNNNTIKTVPYFYLNGSSDYMRAAVALYYNDIVGNTNPDSVRTAFLNFVGTDCAHYNRIRRSYIGSWANTYLQSTAVSDTVMFLQNEPGGALDIRIPYIKNLPQGIINKAQLVITQIPQPGDPTDLFTTPSRIYPMSIDADGTIRTLVDRGDVNTSPGLDFMDGNRNIVTLPNGQTVSQYYINLPREVQNAIVKNVDELHLRINGTVTFPGAYRLIAGGGKHSNNLYRIRLNISYSKIN